MSVPEVITYQETRFQASETEIQENKCSGEHLAACALQYPAKSNCFISRYNKWECCGDDADCAKRKSEIYKATSDELQENKCSDEHLAACANQYPVNYACYISSKASWECAENCDGHEKCTQICKYGNSKSDAKGSRKVCVNNEWQDDAYPVVSAGPATAPAYNGVVAIYNTKEEKLETPAVLIHPNWVLALDYAFRYAIDTNYYRYYPDNSYKVISTGNTMDELKSSQHKIKKIYYGSDVNSRFTGLALIELESPVPETEAYPLPLISPHNLITNAQLSSQTFLTTAVGFGPAPKDEKLKQSVGVEHRGTKYQITMPALDACSHTDKGTQDGTDCTYSDVKYPVGLLYSRFSLADPESGTGSPVFITTEEFPGVAVAAIAYIERINKNGDNFMTRYDKLVQDNVYKSYTNTDFIKEIAPEVYTYHEDRKAASPTEIESKTCSAEHLAMCATQYPDKDHECFVMLRQNLDKSYENIWGCCEGKGCAATKN